MVGDKELDNGLVDVVVRVTPQVAEALRHGKLTGISMSAEVELKKRPISFQAEHCVLVMGLLEKELVPTREPTITNGLVGELRTAAIRLLTATVGVDASGAHIPGQDLQGEQISSFMKRLIDVETKLNGLQSQLCILFERIEEVESIGIWAALEDYGTQVEIVKRGLQELQQVFDKKIVEEDGTD